MKSRMCDPVCMQKPEPFTISIAAYPTNDAPEIQVVSDTELRQVLEDSLRLVMEKVTAYGGRVPEDAVRELIHNLIHAEFRGAVISVLEEGDVVRVSDKGPGINDKVRAFEFGYSGAKPEVLQNIRGVGGGLGIAQAVAEKGGGRVFLDDNLGGGTVAVVSMKDKPLPAYLKHSAPHFIPKDALGEHAGKKKGTNAITFKDSEGNRRTLTPRQMYVLMVVFEGGEVGPTAVADRILTMSVSTAYRDLLTLQQKHLVVHAYDMDPGKYALTGSGAAVVEDFFNIKDDYSSLYESVTEMLDKVVDDSADDFLKEIKRTPPKNTKDREERED